MLKSKIMHDYSQLSWEQLISNIVDAYIKGVSDEDISKMYEGVPVEWVGEIFEIDLNNEYAYLRGVKMHMPEVYIALPKGNKYVQEKENFSFVNGNEKSWHLYKIGDKVKFKGKIKEKKYPFTSIEIDAYSSGRVGITFAIDNAVAIEKVS
jgi:hypothetical protein